MPTSRVEFDPSPGITSHRLIGASPTRVGVTFSAPQAGSAWVSNDPMSGQNQGFPLVAGMQPMTLRYEIHGDMVSREWHIIYTAGATAIGFAQELT